MLNTSTNITNKITNMNMVKYNTKLGVYAVSVSEVAVATAGVRFSYTILNFMLT